MKATITLLRETRSVYADLTPVIRDVTPLDHRELHGLEHRLLFGSDAPNTGVLIEDAIAHVRGLGLSAAHTDAILGGTAQKLLAR